MALHARLKCYQQGHQPCYLIPGEILLTESSKFDESNSPSQMTQIWIKRLGQKVSSKLQISFLKS